MDLFVVIVNGNINLSIPSIKQWTAWWNQWSQELNKIKIHIDQQDCDDVKRTLSATVQCISHVEIWQFL